MGAPWQRCLVCDARSEGGQKSPSKAAPCGQSFLLVPRQSTALSHPTAEQELVALVVLSWGSAVVWLTAPLPLQQGSSELAITSALQGSTRLSILHTGFRSSTRVASPLPAPGAGLSPFPNKRNELA